MDMIVHEVLMVQVVCMAFHNIDMYMSMNLMKFLVNDTYIS